MRERRGKLNAVDTGARTRRSDHIKTPHAFRELPATFFLRWAEHVKHTPPRAA